MSSKRQTTSPIGERHREAMRLRSRRQAYRKEAARIAPYEALARFVIRRRSELGLTQADLAKRMGTSHSAISRIESGQHRTSVETLRRLAAALDTHLVVGFHDDPKKLEEEPISKDAARGLELVTVS
jgi:ribosome-binding protein aMBF1 (putative translation factor)